MQKFNKKFFIFFVPILIFAQSSFAQKPGKTQNLHEGVVTYAFKSNGKDLNEAHPLQLFYKNNTAHLIQGNSSQKNEDNYFDFKQQVTYQILTQKNGEKVTMKTPFSTYEKATILADTAHILGYVCKKAKVIIRSNTIDIWYTDKIPLKGGPSLSVAPGLGLILKTVRNGNFETYATKVEIKNISDSLAELPKALGEIVDEATFRRKEIDNRFTTVPVFSHQQINFTDSIVNPPAGQKNITYRYAGGTLVLKKIELPESRNNTVFAKLSQYSNGDAYDRTGSVFIIPIDREISFLNGLQKNVHALPLYTDKQGKEYNGVVMTDHYLPPVELMRFFTPFGIRYYNHRSKIKGYNWADSAVFKQDITDIAARLHGEVWIGVYIGNYDKGGHIINLELEYHPEREGDNKKDAWVEPIFNTVNLMEMAGQNYPTMFNEDSLTVSVNIPEGLKKISLRYIATGHGGWGNGDEFNQKLNEIFIDGKKVFEFIPWRTDCGTYRMLNPSSGNFGNGNSSSDLSRSNWCPGTTTNPVYIPLNLTPGQHTFKVAIPLGKPEGNSFSSWNISGCLVGEY